MLGTNVLLVVRTWHLCAFNRLDRVRCYDEILEKIKYDAKVTSSLKKRRGVCLCVCVCALLPGGCQTIKWHGSSQHKNRASRAKSDDGISARGLFALSLSLGVIAHGTYQCGGLGFCEWFQRNGSLLVEGRGEAEAVVSKHRLLVVIPTRFPTSLEPNCRLFSLSHTPSSASSPIVQAYGIIAAHIIIHRPHPPRLHRLSRVRRRLRPCSVPGRQRWQLGE